ncbi:MAG: amidohydrolase family protein, partial [Acidobacteria bacterium]|nr:amidohydrolase family protein [Acidobacteriota bacterium]
EAFFRPNLDNHGSFYTDWTTEDEIYWKENYRIWMKALKDFAGKGGVVGTGEDAGFIYRIYGFGYLRELELQQEAGFHPLQVIKHATLNGAAILGRESELGRVRAGWLADLVVVNSNPLQNFKALYPHNGGIEWTIKDGIPYSVSALKAEITRMVSSARNGK